jgi:two-component system, chemotaxis family, response regulator Rcp1
MQFPSSVHVLIVEDNPADVYLLREALRGVSAIQQVSVVVDGEEALQFFAQTGAFQSAALPNLVFLDLNLPKCSGHEVLASVKHHPDWRRIPIIVFSSSSSSRDIQRAYQEAANCYIAKPQDLDGFLQIADAIEKFWFKTALLPACQQGISPRAVSGVRVQRTADGL